MVHRANPHRGIVENLRIMLAIIAGLLVLEANPAAMPPLLFAVLAFSAYACILLWKASQGLLEVQRRFFFWLDACWFLLLIYLAKDDGSRYFLFLLFPIFLAAWHTGYRESVAIAAFSGFGALLVFAFNDPQIPWSQLLAMPFSLFLIGQVFVVLARVEEATQKKLSLSSELDVSADPRQGFDVIAPDLIGQIAGKLNASVAMLALRTSAGRPWTICWEEANAVFEPSEAMTAQLVKETLSLPADVGVGWRQGDGRRWWRRDRQIEIDQSGRPSESLRARPGTLRALARLAGSDLLLSVPIAAGSVGQMRLVLAGSAMAVNMQSLSMLHSIAEKFGPTIENARLREELVSQAADAERARIGRDLHDSAIQPYIGLKFAVEAVQRRAGPENPVAPDLARLMEMVTAELTTMREVVSGLRGDPGQGGVLLSSAVRRHAARFGQLFGIDVIVDIEHDLPVSRRLAGEVFHMVAEGLSNIGRHTRSRWALVSMSVQGDILVLHVRNKNDLKAEVEAGFVPRSLTERAEDLGGSVNIQRDALQTTVTIRLPISDHKSSKQGRSGQSEHSS